MKKFKQFILENETTSIKPLESDVQMTDFNLPQQQKPQEQPTGKVLPKTQVAKQTNKSNMPEDENFPEEVGQDDGEEPQTEEQWRERNKEPEMEDFDKDGDGKLSEEELFDYEQAYETWLYYLELWRHDQKEPKPEDFDGRIGEYQEAYEKWVRERNRIYHRFDPDTFPDPEQQNPGKLPPGADYEYWWTLFRQIYGNDGDMQQFYDWVWRMMRGQTPGFEHIDPPDEFEYPIP